jgi:hydrogenase maturation protein HypF
VGALCGLRSAVTYEGQAAVELEAAATGAGPADRGYPLPFDGGRLDGRITIAAVMEDLEGGVPPATVAARVHAGVASGTAEACSRVAREAGLDCVVLSGGVFQNRLLLELTVADLEQRGLRVLLPERLPPNDGGIAYGQAAVAAARLAD